MRFEADAFLFDLDGTLINSVPAFTRVWRQWALEQKLDPEEVVAACHGRRSIDTLMKFAPHLPQPATNEEFIRREINDTAGITPIPGALEFLRALPRDRWAIVTSCSLELARARMNVTGVPMPAVLVTADLVARGKPEPDGFLLAARKLGVSPGRCLVFEDAAAGIEAGRRAGMNVITITATHEHPLTGGNPIPDYRRLKLSIGSTLSVEIL